MRSGVRVMISVSARAKGRALGWVRAEARPAAAFASLASRVSLGLAPGSGLRLELSCAFASASSASTVASACCTTNLERAAATASSSSGLERG